MLPARDRKRKGMSEKSREEIKREYKERRKPAGVFQVRNKSNGKVLLGSSLNLEGPLNSHRFMLNIGRHRNDTLQKEWNEVGADQFAFEILEVVKVTDDPNFDLSDELALLEQIWLDSAVYTIRKCNSASPLCHCFYIGEMDC